MIDFKNATFLKLRQVSNDSGFQMIGPILINGETIVSSYQTVRDMVIFTTKRIIAVNVQGLSGKKKDFTTLPYSKIQSFSVESAGLFDLDCELELWFSGLGKVKFEFVGSLNITSIARHIGDYVLK